MAVRTLYTVLLTLLQIKY